MDWLFSMPGERRFERVKGPRQPGSGKVIAKAKGVRREVESKGRQRLWKVKYYEKSLLKNIVTLRPLTS